MTYTYKLFASVYGADAYSSGLYEQTQGTSTGSNAGGGPLANTGYDIIIPASLGLSIIAASAMLLIKKFYRAKKQS